MVRLFHTVRHPNAQQESTKAQTVPERAVKPMARTVRGSTLLLLWTILVMRSANKSGSVAHNVERGTRQPENRSEKAVNFRVQMKQKSIELETQDIYTRSRR